MKALSGTHDTPAYIGGSLKSRASSEDFSGRVALYGSQQSKLKTPYGLISTLDKETARHPGLQPGPHPAFCQNDRKLTLDACQPHFCIQDTIQQLGEQ